MAHLTGIQLRFNEGSLEAAAGPTSFSRGEGYAGAVRGLDIGDGTMIRATVPGRETYRVELAVTRQAKVTGTCDCPHAASGYFCKHLVAVGLAALRQTAPAVPEPPLDAAAAARSAKLPAGQEEVADWLTSLDRDALLALLSEESAADAVLRDRLLLRAEVARADRAQVRDRVKGLLGPGPWIYGQDADPDEAAAYTRQVAEVVTIMRALAAAHRMEEAVSGIRWVLWRLGQVYEHADDYYDYEPHVRDLGEVHLRACRAVHPDPEGTARWLVATLLGRFGWMTLADPADYRDLLGPAGLTRALDLATEAWRQDPTREAARLRKRLLKVRGDVDALVAVYAADLAPDGTTHLKIARELEKADRAEQALEWAERGLRAAGELPDADRRLVDWIFTRYLRDGRHDDALALHRDRFRSRSSLRFYRSLRSAAQACGRWEVEREAALALLRADADRGDHVPGGGHPKRLLIDALLDDGDLDAAWQAAPGHATEGQLRTIADRMRDYRPAVALTIYLGMLGEDVKQSTDVGICRDSARVLRSIRVCHEQLGTPEEFSRYLAELRAEFKKNKTLMRTLKAKGL